MNKEAQQNFTHGKGRDVKELKNSECAQDRAFIVDITDLLQLLHKRLQDCNKIITKLYDAICACELTLKCAASTSIYTFMCIDIRT